MPDLPNGFTMPSDAEWQRWGERGEMTARNAIGKLALRTVKQQPASLHAIGFGALVAAGDFLRAVTGPAGQHVNEQWALATLRGALRGAEGPITDSGKPFVRTTDG